MVDPNPILDLANCIVVPTGGTVAMTMPDVAALAASTHGALNLWFNHNPVTDLLLPSITSTALACVASTPPTVTRSDGGDFAADGFVVGMKVAMTGWTPPGNNRTITLRAVTTNTLTALTSETLTAEGAGPTVTLAQQREQFTRTPSAAGEQTETLVISTGAPAVPVDCYMTDAGVPGVTSLNPGTWTFLGWASATASGTTTMSFAVKKVNATTGVETVLFTTTAVNLTTSPVGYTVNYTVTTPIALTVTDRLMVCPMFQTTGSGVTVTWYYEGTARASNLVAAVPVQALNLWNAGQVNAIGTKLVLSAGTLDVA